MTPKRPRTLSRQHLNVLFFELASEVIKHNWSQSDIDSIMNDLRQLRFKDSVHDIKDYINSSYTIKCQYSNAPEFIDWLGSLDSRFKSRLKDVQIQWVKDNNIRTQIRITSVIKFRGYIYYINGCDFETAEYLIYPKRKAKTNIRIPFENLENNCEIMRR